ncbi:hypothetical protein [Lacipirellula parvula]|uniref:PEP-CTERM protein-sorting domain-containing protein n=1 Tax=Lacipirellula parvula TaxID=2650471 RepID=A0A5K7X7X2_9BACT|nr:hypothetical protein [Lacipirellula parvula]BBO32720.1 hypothetical protein PLANPX_2332 [Lacipirellula parvula]
MKFSHLSLSCLLALSTCSLAPNSARAHSDALLTNVGGQVAVGTAADIDGPEEAFGLHADVFEAILRSGFAPPTPADFEGDEPGFFGLHGVNDAAKLAALGAAALPPGAAVTGSITTFTVNGASDSLFYWNGVGAVDFQPISAAQPGVTFAFSPAAFGATGPNGALDDHPIYQINHPTGTPADGVYLVAPTIGVAGLSDSRPFYMAFLVDALITGEDELELVEAALEGLEEEATPDALADFGGGVAKDFAYYETSVAWIEGNLVVPEPATASLGALSFLALLATRRKR